jgi:hypothetical protein
MRLLLGFLLVCGAATAQVVFLPPGYCEQLKVTPNLHVAANNTIRARLTDRTGEVFKDTPVELRQFVSQQEQVHVANTNTDARGEFILHDVPKGEYRLLVTDAKRRGFRQPGEMWCKPEKPCALEIVLEVMPTDQPESLCPLR